MPSAFVQKKENQSRLQGSPRCVSDCTFGLIFKGEPIFFLAMAADGFCTQTTPNQISRIRVMAPLWCLGDSVHAM